MRLMSMSMIFKDEQQNGKTVVLMTEKRDRESEI